MDGKVHLYNTIVGYQGGHKTEEVTCFDNMLSVFLEMAATLASCN
jgi:hypothetical protein